MTKHNCHKNIAIAKYINHDKQILSELAWLRDKCVELKSAGLCLKNMYFLCTNKKQRPCC